jgi:hypothetical protein
MDGTATGFRGVVLATLLGMAGPALAATIYGTVRDNQGKPVPSVRVALTCGTASFPAVRTDSRGGYRITASQSGRCSIQIGSASSQNVSLYDGQPARYDFVLIDSKTVRRR